MCSALWHAHTHEQTPLCASRARAPTHPYVNSAWRDHRCTFTGCCVALVPLKCSFTLHVQPGSHPRPRTAQARCHGASCGKSRCVPRLRQPPRCGRRSSRAARQHSTFTPAAPASHAAHGVRPACAHSWLAEHTAHARCDDLQHARGVARTRPSLQRAPGPAFLDFAAGLEAAMPLIFSASTWCVTPL